MNKRKPSRWVVDKRGRGKYAGIEIFSHQHVAECKNSIVMEVVDRLDISGECGTKTIEYLRSTTK